MIAMMVSGAFAAQSGPVPGKFDYYVFSLSWQPAFCESHQGKKECNTWKDGDFDTKNLVLHGLWPSQNGDKKHTYGYCNVSADIKKLDNASNWCAMPFPSLSSSTIDTLNVVMPGYQSCLENHEWYKHGVCSGMDADSYFATASRFVEGIATTKLGAVVTAHVGGEVALNDLTAAAAQDYGDKSGTLRFICQNGILNEVRLYLKKDLPDQGGITADLLVSPDASEKSSCSGTVRIDQFGNQSSTTAAHVNGKHKKKHASREAVTQ
jgi:ribonuclease T2